MTTMIKCYSAAPRSPFAGGDQEKEPVLVEVDNDDMNSQCPCCFQPAYVHEQATAAEVAAAGAAADDGDDQIRSRPFGGG